MSGLGVHFALTPREGEKLLDATDNPEALMRFVMQIEQRWERKWLCETDKAWDAIHRCLTDGKLHYGETPLHQCILGEDNLNDGDDYFVNIVMAEEVQAVAAAIRNIDREWLLAKYRKIKQRGYEALLCDEDFEYTWDNFVDLRTFFEKAARYGRWVVFTTDL